MEGPYPVTIGVVLGQMFAFWCFFKLSDLPKPAIYSIIKTYIKRISPANALHRIATYWLLPATHEKGQQQWPEITMKSIHQEDLRGISLPPLQGVSNHHWVCPLHILCIFFGWSFTLQPAGDSTNQFDASSRVMFFMSSVAACSSLCWCSAILHLLQQLILVINELK